MKREYWKTWEYWILGPVCMLLLPLTLVSLALAKWEVAKGVLGVGLSVFGVLSGETPVLRLKAPAPQPLSVSIKALME